MSTPETQYMPVPAPGAAPTRPLRVLHVLGYAAVGGRAAGITGVERVVKLLFEHLDPTTFKQYVAYPPAGRLTPWLQARATAMLAQEPVKRFDRVFLGSLLHFMREHEVGLVVSMGMRHDFHAALACARLRVPHLVHRPVALADEPMPWLRKQFFGLFDAWTLRRCAGIVACSQASASRMVHTQRISAARIQVVANGVLPLEGNALVRQAARCELGAEPGDIVVGGVGQLIARKAFGDLVRALARVQALVPGLRSRCVLLGEGPERDLLQTLARQHGVPLHLAGFVEDPERLMAGFDISVLPSRAEGMPLVVLEAMAMGIPPIATHVAGTPEVIEEGVSGLLIPPGDIDACARAIARLATAPKLRAAMGKAARERVVQQFSLDAMMDGFAAAFRRAAAQTSEP